MLCMLWFTSFECPCCVCCGAAKFKLAPALLSLAGSDSWPLFKPIQVYCMLVLTNVPLVLLYRTTMSTPVKRTILFKQFKVTCPREDTATIPLFHNKWVSTPDSTWVTPSTMFYQKVLGEGIMLEDEYKLEVEGLQSRQASRAEMLTLQKHAYLGPTTLEPPYLIPVQDLSAMLKALGSQHLEATLASLEDLPPLEGTNAGRSSTSMFPDSIPLCLLDDEELWGPYSLTATANHLAAKGTKWGKQQAALEKFKTQPPLSSHGRVSKVGGTTLELMMRSLDEYMGYAHKYHAVSPSMDLVMQPSMFSKFMAFKLARGNAASTLLRTAQQVSLVVPFVLSGHCPQVQTWGPGHAAQVKHWYSNLKGGYRQEQSATPSKRSALSLADQWEAVDAGWTAFKEDFQVGGHAHSLELTAYFT
jgi:hypothetical protein